MSYHVPCYEMLLTAAAHTAGPALPLKAMLALNPTAARREMFKRQIELRRREQEAFMWAQVRFNGSLGLQ